MKSFIKIVLVILTALSAASSAQAQKLTVESMTMEPMDLSASKYVRNDLNGKACALVKVEIPLEGMVFEGNVMGDVENKAGEYWVYLTAGTKFFKIKHKSVSPLFLTFADYGLEPISGRTTYVLRLAAPASAASVQPMEEVTFKVTPAGASLFVDDEEREVVGGVAKIQLTHGSHKCNVLCPGYKSVIDEFVVRKGMPKRVYELEIKSATSATTIDQVGNDSDFSGDTTDGWMDIVCSKDLSFDQVWNRLKGITGKLFSNYETLDKSSGCIKTYWRVTRFQAYYVRTRFESRLSENVSGIACRIRIVSEIKDVTCRGDDCYKPYNQVIDKYKQMVEDLRTSLVDR